MAVLILTCEIFRPEFELLAEEGVELPEIRYLEFELHNIPDKLRAYVQAVVDEFEAAHPEPSEIRMCYGLCGRGLIGVRAKHATLIFPRVHDCISLLLNKEQSEDNFATRDAPIYWSSPGMLRSSQIQLHLHYDERFAMFEQKFGTKKALRMMKAEKALFSNYECVGYIQWPEMKGRYEETARLVAEDARIPYREYPSSSDFFRELVRGGTNPARFLRLAPGETIDMALNGDVIAVKAED